MHLAVDDILYLWRHRLKGIGIIEVRLRKINATRWRLLDDIMLGSLLNKVLLKELLLGLPYHRLLILKRHILFNSVLRLVFLLHFYKK